MKNQKGFAPIIVILILVLLGGGTYAVVNRAVLKSYFEKGDKPTEIQRTELKDKFKDGDIPTEADKTTKDTDKPIIVKVPEKIVTTVSTSLPPKYVKIGGGGTWPPVIKESDTPYYSCIVRTVGALTDPAPETKERVINGKTYCISSFVDAAAGHRFGVYTYTTANGSGTETTSFQLEWPDCGVYGGPGDTEYEECKATVNGFIGNLDVVIDTLMQTSIKSQTSVSTNKAPQLTSLNPTSGAIGAIIKATGQGFDSTHNIVHVDVGNVQKAVSSGNSGTTLNFPIPEYKLPSCAFVEHPTCPTATTKFEPGTYTVYIETPNGMSNGLPFVITSPL